MIKHFVFYKRLIFAIDCIMKSSPKKLQNENYVAELIRIMGIHNANEETYGKESYCGTGDESGLCHEPTQSSKLLVWLSDKKIENFIEVGTLNGCWSLFMSAYFSKFGLKKAYSIDVKNTALPFVIKLAQRFNLLYVDNIPDGVYDFAFLGGHNNYQQIYEYWYKINKNKIIAIHNINHADTKQFWYDRLKVISNMEILDNQNNLGIGVINVDA